MSDVEVGRRDAAILLLQKAVLDALQELNGKDRARVAEALRIGESKVGEVGGVALGTVKLKNPAGGARQARVTNPVAFEAWVRDRHPESWREAGRETVEVPAGVHAGAQKNFLAAVVRDGGWVDTVTGEVEPVPGVETYDKPGVLEVKVDDAAAAPLVAEILRAAGVVGLLELEP